MIQDQGEIQWKEQLEKFIEDHHDSGVLQFSYLHKEKEIKLSEAMVILKQLNILYAEEELQQKENIFVQAGDQEAIIEWNGPILVKKKFLASSQELNKYQGDNLLRYFSKHYSQLKPFAWVCQKNKCFLAIQQNILRLPFVIYNLGPSSIVWNFINDNRDFHDILKIMKPEGFNSLNKSLVFADIDTLRLNNIKFNSVEIHPGTSFYVNNCQSYWQQSNENAIIIKMIHIPDNFESLDQCWNQYKIIRNQPDVNLEIPLLRIFIDIYLHQSKTSVREKQTKLFINMMDEQQQIQSEICKFTSKENNIKYIKTIKDVLGTNQDFKCQRCRSEIIIYYYNKNFNQNVEIICLQCLYIEKCKQKINPQKHIYRVRKMYKFANKKDNLLKGQCLEVHKKPFECDQLNDMMLLQMTKNNIQFEDTSKQLSKELNQLIAEEPYLIKLSGRRFEKLKKFRLGQLK